MAKAKPRGDDLPRTLQEFDEWHARQPERWEFIGGEPVMMTPPATDHTRIKGNIYRRLANALDGKTCEAFVDGVEIKSRGLSAIPDVVVSCSPVDGSIATIPEPTVIVEVISPSTEPFDRVEKWAAYRLCPSLWHYLIVSSDHRLVEMHTRQGPSVFEERFVEQGDVHLEGIDVTLPIDQIYQGVVLADDDRDTDG